MKQPTTLLGHLEAWAQEEIGAQQRLLGLLNQQERALRAKRSEDQRRLVDSVEAELEGRDARERRRREIFEAFARAWEVSAGALTLGSIAERLYPHAARLLRMRSQLDQLGRQVEAQGRRAAMLVSVNRRVLQDVIEFLVGAEPNSQPGARGRLVDARA